MRAALEALNNPHDPLHLLFYTQFVPRLELLWKNHTAWASQGYMTRHTPGAWLKAFADGMLYGEDPPDMASLTYVAHDGSRADAQAALAIKRFDPAELGLLLCVGLLRTLIESALAAHQRCGMIQAKLATNPPQDATPEDQLLKRLQNAARFAEAALAALPDPPGTFVASFTIAHGEGRIESAEILRSDGVEIARVATTMLVSHHPQLQLLRTREETTPERVYRVSFKLIGLLPFHVNLQWIGDNHSGEYTLFQTHEAKVTLKR